jgi:Ssp1 endopeptidase immunity protein Rap1a
MKRITLAFVIFVISQIPVMTWAQTGVSGNDSIEGCRGYVEQSQTVPAFRQASCIAAVEAVLQLSGHLVEQYRFCLPNNVILGQAARVAVKFMDDQPGLLNQDFIVILLMAYRQARPCR